MKGNLCTQNLKLSLNNIFTFCSGLPGFQGTKRNVKNYIGLPGDKQPFRQQTLTEMYNARFSVTLISTLQCSTAFIFVLIILVLAEELWSSYLTKGQITHTQYLFLFIKYFYPYFLPQQNHSKMNETFSIRHDDAISGFYEIF